MRIPGVDKAKENLVKWAAREEWEEPHAEIYATHIEPVADIVDMSGDEIAALLGDSAVMLHFFITEDFFAARFGEEDELNLIDDYLKRRGWRETVSARRYLEALRDSHVSLYEIVDIDPGRSVTVRDLILGGEAVTVNEKLGSKSLARWDRVAARIVTVNGKEVFTGGILRFRHEASQELLSAFDELANRMIEKLREEAEEGSEDLPLELETVRRYIVRGLPCAPIFSEHWTVDTVMRMQAPPPEFRNSDDEAIVFCEVRFPIAGDEARLAAVLDGIEAFERVEGDEAHWAWLAPGSPFHRMDGDGGDPPAAEAEDTIRMTSLGDAALQSGALVLTVNSQKRAERGRDLLASRLGDLVGSPLISHRDPEQAMAEHAEQPDDELGIPPEEAARIIHAYFDEHFRRTLDEPLPILDGKTPRQAAATPEGRAQAIDWLKQMENTEHHRAAQQGEKPYDTAWIWRELGLEAPR
ncbi:MAG: hypothetical protein OXI57_01045 [Rhodospirillales bacterium]|nr:hypothetical protein [Rhodospirillales bacterium]